MLKEDLRTDDFQSESSTDQVAVGGERTGRVSIEQFGFLSFEGSAALF